MDLDPLEVEIVQDIYAPLKDTVLDFSVNPWNEVLCVQEDKRTTLEVKTWIQNDKETSATKATTQVLNVCNTDIPK